MKKRLLIILVAVLLIFTLISCGETSTETDTQSETDTQGETNTETDTQGETSTETDTQSETNTETDTQDEISTDTDQSGKGVLYEQINGGKFLEKLDESTIIAGDTITAYSPYRLIYTYDELMELAENASEIDSTIFEENAILYVKLTYASLYGEAIGYSDFKIIDEKLFITYSRYEYRLGIASEVITYYKDYIVIPKKEIPNEISKSGEIGVLINSISLEYTQGSNEVEALSLPLNSAWIFETSAERNEFMLTYGVDKDYYSFDELDIAIYLKRPIRKKYNDQSDQLVHEGYLCVIEGNVLKLTYLYDGENADNMEYYIDFISLPEDMLENIEVIEVDVKAR